MNFNPYNIQATPIPMAELDINKIFDDNGLDLYKELQDKYIFLFYYYNQGGLAIDLNDSFVSFLIPQNKNVIKPLFTHELLHLYLQYNNINNKYVLLNSIKNFALSESFLFHENEIMYIHNFLDHIIIYNDFKEMGYKDNEFVIDYNENRFNNDVASFLRQKFKFNSPDDYAISFFISKYIGLRSPICSIRDYSKAYKMMRSLNPQLYKVCKEFVDEYTSISNESYSYIANTYRDIINSFIIKLKNVVKIENRKRDSSGFQLTD